MHLQDKLSDSCPQIQWMQRCGDVLRDVYAVKECDMVSYQTYAMESVKFFWIDDEEDFKVLNQNDGSLMFASSQRAPSNFTTFQDKEIVRDENSRLGRMRFAPILLGCFTLKLSDVCKTMIDLHIDGGPNTFVLSRYG